jgi:hypothetical protein
MDVALGSLINLYVFSTGRRLFAMQQVQKRAAERGFAELTTHAERAIENDRLTRQLDGRWAARQLRPVPGEDAVQRIDAVVDRTLTALRDGAESQAAVARPGDGTAEKVGGFLREIFPMGVAAVMSMTYVEELAAVDSIVAKLTGPLAPVVGELGLGRHADRLAELAVEYRAALEGPRSEPLDFGQVRAARARGHEMLLQAAAIIMGRYPLSTPEHIEARAALLGPILEQNEAIRQYFRARRMVEDVDPDTGEVDAAAPPSLPGAGLSPLR